LRRWSSGSSLGS